MTERVQHGVVRVYRGESFLVQLVPNYHHYFPHPHFVARPVAYDLHAVGEVAVRVAKLGFQFQCHLVGLDCFGDLAWVVWVWRVLNREVNCSGSDVPIWMFGTIRDRIYLNSN